MRLLDVNVLVYAHRREHPEQERYGQWLTQVVTGSEPFGLSELVRNEHGCERVTADSDFSRFDGLRWRHPFQAGA